MAGPYTRRQDNDLIEPVFFNELQEGIEEHEDAVVPIGGRVYQPLVKASGADHDVRWEVVPKSLSPHDIGHSPVLKVLDTVYFGPGSHGPGSTGLTSDFDVSYGGQHAVWFDVPVGGAIVDQVRFYVPTPQAGGVIYPYIYDDDGFFPNALVWSWGGNGSGFTTDIPGHKLLTITPPLQWNEGERYWIVVESNVPSDFSSEGPLRFGVTSSGQGQSPTTGASLGALDIGRDHTPTGPLPNIRDDTHGFYPFRSANFPIASFRSIMP